MSREKDFFKLLRTKIHREPDRRFDQIFWSKFEAEFGMPAEKSAPFWARLLSFRVGIFATASVAATALALLLILPGRLGRGPHDGGFSDLSRTGDLALISTLGEDAPLWENFDLFETVGDLALSDQEWDELISPAGPAAGEEDDTT